MTVFEISNKIELIKIIRKITSMGLKEAKLIAEGIIAIYGKHMDLLDFVELVKSADSIMLRADQNNFSSKLDLYIKPTHLFALADLIKYIGNEYVAGIADVADSYDDSPIY